MSSAPVRSSSQVEIYQGLLNMSRAILLCQNLPELSAAVGRSIADMVDGRYFAIQLVEDDRKVLVTYISEIGGDYSAIRRRRVPLNEAPGGEVYLSQSAMVISDFSTETRWPRGTRVVLGEYGCRSVAYFPLTTSRQRVGVMAFLARPPNAFGPAEVDLLGRIADQVAVAVEPAPRGNRPAPAGTRAAA